MQAYVFGTEGRVLQTPTTSFPFRGVVKLLIKFPNTQDGKAVGCTGSLIGGKHVLTAGHCVFQSDQGGWATSIRAIPGLDGTIPPFDVDEVAPFGDAFRVAKRSVKGWSEDNDWPRLRLRRRHLEQNLQPRIVRTSHSLGRPFGQHQVLPHGYPGELGNGKGNRQYFIPGCESIWAYGSKHVEFKMDTSAGNSGSPICRFWNGKRAIFAVNCCEVSPFVGSATTPARASRKSAMISFADGNARTAFKAPVEAAELVRGFVA